MTNGDTVLLIVNTGFISYPQKKRLYALVGKFHFMNKKKSIMKVQLIITLTVSSIVFSAPGLAAKFYRWTDENGGIHYSDKPDANNTAETVDIYAPKPASGSGNSSTGSQTSSNNENNPSENKNSQHANSVEEYCKKLSENIKTLETKSNITSVDTEGKKTNLSKDEQQKTLDKSKQEYESRCQAQ